MADPSRGLNAARESHAPGRDSIHTAGRTHSRETQLAGQWVPVSLPALAPTQQTQCSQLLLSCSSALGKQDICKSLRS